MCVWSHINICVNFPCISVWIGIRFPRLISFGWKLIFGWTALPHLWEWCNSRLYDSAVCLDCDACLYCVVCVTLMMKRQVFITLIYLIAVSNPVKFAKGEVGKYYLQWQYKNTNNFIIIFMYFALFSFPSLNFNHPLQSMTKSENTLDSRSSIPLTQLKPTWSISDHLCWRYPQQKRQQEAYLRQHLWRSRADDEGALCMCMWSLVNTQKRSSRA